MAGNFKNLPPWAKGTVAVALTIGGGIAVFYAVRGIRNLVSSISESKGQREELSTASDELKQLNKSNSTKQTLTGSQLASMANNIQKALSGAGTDEQTVYAQFSKLKNDADFLALEKAFGVRKIDDYTVDAFLTESLFGNTTSKGTLSQLIHGDMESDEIKYINGILSKKKIKYKI